MSIFLFFFRDMVSCGLLPVLYQVIEVSGKVLNHCSMYTEMLTQCGLLFYPVISLITVMCRYCVHVVWNSLLLQENHSNPLSQVLQHSTFVLNSIIHYKDTNIDELYNQGNFIHVVPNLRFLLLCSCKIFMNCACPVSFSSTFDFLDLTKIYFSTPTQTFRETNRAQDRLEGRTL